MKKIMREKNIDGVYITDLYNLRYLAGFTGTTGSAFITEDKKYFFTDFRYKEQALKEAGKMGFQVVIIERNSIDIIAKFIIETGVKKVGVEDNSLTVALYDKITANFAGIEIIKLGNSIQKIRMIKSEDEIKIVRKATEIADLAFMEIQKDIKEGVSEREIAAKLEYIMKMNGAEDKSFDTIVASGYRSAWPHGVASDKKIEKNEFIKLDFGCYYNGYVSDITRTLFYGDKISAKHIEIYEIVKEAQQLGIDSVRAGITGKELDTIVREYIKLKGYWDNFGHGLGHGIGVEIHELPTVSQAGEITLEENMLITIEPGIYIEGFGGVRIEDDVVVKKNGCEILTKSSKNLIILK
jgi:Xaa-Pro aminopeptidase